MPVPASLRVLPIECLRGEPYISVVYVHRSIYMLRASYLNVDPQWDVGGSSECDRRNAPVVFEQVGPFQVI